MIAGERPSIRVGFAVDDLVQSPARERVGGKVDELPEQKKRHGVLHHLLHGLLVTGRESMSKRGIGRYTQQGVNLVPLVRGLTVLKLDEQGSEVSVLVPPRLPYPPSRQDIENRSGLVLGEHRQEGSKVEKGPRRNVLTAAHEHDGPGAGDLFDDPDPRKPGATEECTESAGKAFADVIVMFHSCRRIPAKWLAHEPQHLPGGGFPSHQRIHLKGVAFQDAHDSHQHIRVLGPLAEPDDTSFGILVYPLHLRNLVALFLLVALVNADGIDPIQRMRSASGLRRCRSAADRLSVTGLWQPSKMMADVVSLLPQL